MDSNILFTKALGLGPGWKVAASEMDVAGRELRLRLNFKRGARFPCAKCGRSCPVHDTVERKQRGSSGQMQNPAMHAEKR